MSATDAQWRRVRVRAAQVVLIFSLVAWPLSSWWVWSQDHEFDAFEQLMLAWSAVAVILVAVDWLTTAQVHEEQASGEIS